MCSIHELHDKERRSLKMPISQQEFADKMASFFDGLGGTVGVMVDHLDTDLVLEYNADERFPTASTMKTPLLYELFRQADAGEIDLTERVITDYSNRVPGSGVLQDLDEGLNPTVRDLAELMIIVSDNWATDLLYERVGKDAMAATLKNLGMDNTYLPLTIREMFCAIADVDPADPKVDFEYLKEALKSNTANDGNIAYSGDPANDVSSPRDMAKLMRIIHEGQGISESGREGILKILKDQNFGTRIPARLPVDEDIETAHKTGSLRGVVNDVGIVYSPKVNYVIAYLSKQQNESVETTDAIARSSRWVWDQLA